MSEGFHIQAASEKAAPVPKTPEEELNLREIKGEAIWEGKKVRLGKSEIVDLEKGHPELLTPAERLAQREQFRLSEEAAAEAAAAAAKQKAEHAEIQVGLAQLAQEKAEAAAKRAEVLANLQRKAQEAAAEKIAKAGKIGEAVAQAVVEQQEATNPQGTNPEDRTVN